MKKYFLVLLGSIAAFSIQAQNAFIDIPQSYWADFKIEDALQKANNGDSEAQFMIALYYTDVDPNIVKFKTWIEKAASLNHSGALCLIAQCYAVGDYGFEQDEEKALKYARLSASLNNVQAISMMFDVYRVGMFGVKKDDSQAVYWIGKGARLGDAYSQYWFGIMLMNGVGCLKDEQQGLLWLQKSADQKYIEAQATLIHYYGTAFIKPNSIARNQESRNKVMSIGLDFLINPDINQNTESILVAKGILGEEFFNRKNYKKGISLMREGLQTQNELLQFYWRTMNKYTQEVLGTTISELENQ